jgi:ribosomal protein S12 methylthiotransferase
VLPYFDLPVQHLVDRLLENMGRRTTYDQISGLVRRIRKAPVESAIRTTLILGFPGEREADVEQLVERLQELQFDKLGCFVYSEEDGTAAAELRPRVGARIAASRRDRIMELQSGISAGRLARLVGKTLPVLVEAEVDGDAGIFIGRSPFDAPDVDGNVVIRAGAVRPAVGTIAPVRIDGAREYDLTGETI